MAPPGRAPAPTNLKLLRGDKKSRINRNEPQIPEGPVERPGWLSKAAEAEWDELAGRLVAAKVLTPVYVPLFGAWCEAMARLKRLATLAAQSPPAVKGREDTVVKNPVFAQVRDATEQAYRLGREFGLTPSARSGLKVEVVLVDPAARLLTGGV